MTQTAYPESEPALPEVSGTEAREHLGIVVPCDSEREAGNHRPIRGIAIAAVISVPIWLLLGSALLT